MSDDWNIDDLYPLSPTQLGMLFHTLYATTPGVYVEQVVCTLRGDLDAPTLQRAWQYLLAHHPVLRTAFLWEEVDEPVQVVNTSVALPWTELDWRTLSESELQTQLLHWLAQDRAQGFDLACPPLLRLAVLRIADDRSFLSWTFHHLLLDGWSMFQLLHEAFTVYHALRLGRRPDLAFRLPYKAYITWLRSQDQGAAETFWRERLRAFTTPTLIHAERPEDVVTPAAEMELMRNTTLPATTGALPQQFWQQSGQPVRLRGLQLSRSSTDALRTFARQRQLTLNTLIQGAWALLLSIYSGRQDVLFGATITGRPTELPDAETMIGLFINTLPVRIAIPAQTSLERWLVDLQAREVEARQYDYCSLAQVQAWSEMTHERSLFESIVVFESYPLPKTSAQGSESAPEVQLERLSILEQTNYPLVLIAVPWDALELLLGYDATRFSTAAIQRMLEQLQTLLEAFPAHAHLSPLTLSPLPERERQRLLTWSQQAPANNQREERRTTSVVAQFQRQVEQTPDAIALVARDEMLSYRELERRANQLAHFLRQYLFEAEARVAVCLDRSHQQFIALLGVLKAGGVYLPLEPHYPAARLAYLFADANVRVILTSEQFRDQCSSFPQAQLLCIDTVAQEISQQPETAPLLTIFPQQAAYLMYTSGTGGFPKGVMVSHEALLQHNVATARHYELSPSDRVLQFASAIFDVSLEEILPSWFSGATVVTWTGRLAPSFEELARLIGEQGLSVLNLPSSYWHEWVAALMHGRTRLGSSLRLLIVGSERVHPAVLLNWQQLVAEQQLSVSWCNAYGLTETTITALSTTPGAFVKDMQKRGAVPLGRPLSGVRAYVLDYALRLVPIGAIGEIYIGGAGLARGYQGRPDLTAERFLPDPFLSQVQAGARIYRTGDQARFLSDGTLDFVGRVDTQVKLRGFRVELAEIEAVLRRYPGVREAVVLLQTLEGERQSTILGDGPDAGADDAVLVGYVTTPRQSPAMRDRLQRYLEAQLPAYMVPSRLLLLEAFPRTPGGKIDRQALKDRHALSATDTHITARPHTLVEELLINIWRMVLRIEHIGRDAHFFQLGGHSLQATQVVARIRETFQVELPVVALYDAPTIAELAVRVEQLRSTEQGQLHVPAITQADRSGAQPLSFAQQRLWFLDRLEPGSPLYNMTGAIRLQGTINYEALEASFTMLVQRHESLRTTFSVLNELPVQVIAPAASISIPVIDLTEIPQSAASDAEVQRLLYTSAHLPFDLTHGPLLRVSLFRLAAQEHLLLLVLHHIVADDWSIGVLIKELSICYSAYCSEQTPVLPPLPIQYADYAVWQRHWLQGAKLEGLLAYWRAQLAAAPALLALPTDRPRQAEAALHGASLSFLCPAPLQQALRLLSQRRGVTLFMALLAAFQVLLLRYSGQDDIVIGTPVAGRLQSATEGLIGLFLNTLVLRTSLAGDPSFDELLERVRTVCLHAYEHQELPFETLVDALQPERSLSYAPLFQVLFVLQNAPQEQLTLPGLTFQPVALERATAKFDLVLTLEETDKGLLGTLEYATALFDASTIARMATHYQRLLNAVVADEHTRLSSLPLLSADELTLQLTTWNRTETTWNRTETTWDLEDETVPRAFERQVALTPHAIALLFEDEQISYSALNERANRVAHYLQSMRVGSDVLVGLYMERSITLVIGLLGILKAGAAYLPLDPAYPDERIGFMLVDSGVPVVLTHQHLADRLPACAARIINLDDDWPEIEQRAGWNLSKHILQDTLAYCIYTSGSTGLPKGTLVPHTGLVNLARAQITAFQVTPASRVLQFASWSFDAAVSELLMAVLAGATLCLQSQARLLPNFELLELLYEKAITTVTLPPSALAALPEPAMHELPALRTLIVAGESCPADLIARWTKHCEVWNAYGPSEASVCATMERCTANTEKPAIGRPIANVQVYILDRWMQPVPPGVHGELYISGPGLARGYLHAPALTAERFVPHPFSHTPGSRLYRSGDLARFLPDGKIDFLGRVDRQVKWHGYRIELGEIEAALRQCPGVREAVVDLRQEQTRPPSLVAYLLAASDEALTPSQVRAFLQTRLPDYLLPAAFVLLPALPLTPNGKLDRQRLPAPEGQERLREPGEELAAHTPIEQLLVRTWCEVLGLPRVGIQQNFFALGGDSIQVIQVCARLRSAGVLLSPRQFFQHQTIALLAEHAQVVQTDADRNDEHAHSAPHSSNLDSELEAVYPLSPMQQGMLFQTLRDPQAGVYCQQVGINLHTALQRDAFKRAWRSTVTRHTMLRTAFRWEGQDEPSQVVYRQVELPWKEEDWRDLPAQEQHARLQALLADDAQTGFSLERAPLMRMQLLHLAPDHWFVLWSHHHLLLDGWSLSLLLAEVATTYEAELRGQMPSLPPAQPFQRYIAWLQQQNLAAAETFWRSYLAGFYESTPLIYAGATSSSDKRSYREVETYLDQHVYERLQAFARQHMLTLNTLLEGVWALLLSRYSGSRDVVLGSTVSTRPAEIEGVGELVGLLINTLPVRVRLAREMELLPWLRELQAQQAEARQYDYCPLAHVQTWSELPPGSPLFESLLAFENNPGIVSDVKGLALQIEPVEAQWGAYPLTVSVRPGEQLLVRVGFEPTRFDETTIALVLEQLKATLERMVAAPQQRLQQVLALSEAERNQVLFTWNASESAFPAQARIQDLFVAQVQQTPDAIAVVYEDQHVSYSALDRYAATIAHVLRARGAGAETLVGVFMQRSVELIAALLGILKAGAAYVPLDTSFPAERLAYIQRETQMSLLITQQMLAQLIPPGPAHVFCLDAGTISEYMKSWSLLLGEDGSEQIKDSASCSENLAYIMYTSGSTGEPKGVAVTHQGIVRLVKETHYARLASDEVFLQFAPVAFDASTLEIWGSLLNGARLVVFPAFSPSLEELALALEQHQITTLWLTAGLFHQMVEAYPEVLARIRQLLAGGDSLAVPQVQRLVQCGGSVINGYGPTENTTFTCCFPVSHSEQIGASVPIGRPIANTQVYLLTDELEPVPVGGQGELYVGGAGLARGYLHQPDLTAERFIPHPFSSSPGARLYRTGDLARYRPDGNLEFIGRRDAQVKIRGYRVEPGEVEALLRQQPGVREATVIVREHPPGNRQLLAYLVPDTREPALDLLALRSRLQQRLPDYMLPAALLIIDTLPLTRNGKVDRRALPPPEALQLSPVQHVDPRNPLEQTLARIWSEVLQVEQIGIYENFFDLGGHSLVVTQIISRISSALQVQLPLRTLFEAPTIAQLAELIMLQEMEQFDDDELTQLLHETDER